ncbi:hypothetical protein VPH35_036635 [Triticum aestivum]|uniref:ubiquitinyl hydrolase 1 n=2 Tax=Aegilops tauschii subsp. strangulata TaxID=200361 RepID=A0A453BFI8_AEGTS
MGDRYLDKQVQNFGEPFFMVIREDETLSSIKERLQKKLKVSDEDFSKQFNRGAGFSSTVTSQAAGLRITNWCSSILCKSEIP